jgi:hypothetical protein
MVRDNLCDISDQIKIKLSNYLFGHVSSISDLCSSHISSRWARF